MKTIFFSFALFFFSLMTLAQKKDDIVVPPGKVLIQLEWRRWNEIVKLGGVCIVWDGSNKIGELKPKATRNNLKNYRIEWVRDPGIVRLELDFNNGQKKNWFFVSTKGVCNVSFDDIYSDYAYFSLDSSLMNIPEIADRVNHFRSADTLSLTILEESSPSLQRITPLNRLNRSLVPVKDCGSEWVQMCEFGPIFILDKNIPCLSWYFRNTYALYATIGKPGETIRVPAKTELNERRIEVNKNTKVRCIIQNSRTLELHCENTDSSSSPFLFKFEYNNESEFLNIITDLLLFTSRANR
jgi:hypothetical protein